MSVNTSHCAFPNYSRSENKIGQFYGTHRCGYPICGHSTELQRDGVNVNSKNIFTSPPPNQLPQFYIASNE